VRSACLLIVGDEILSGEIRDENGPWLLKRLAEAGVRVERVATCPDVEADVVAEVLRLRALADAVLVCGGIGPTHDDVTRQALARALGVPVVRHPDADRRIREFFKSDVTASDLEMALLPKDARLLLGPITGTIGFERAGLYAFPGVPFLLRDLVEAVLPEFRGAPLSKAEVVTDLREGQLAPALGRVQAESPDVAIGSYPAVADGRWVVRLVLRSASVDRLHVVSGRLREVLAELCRTGA
jgi:molybdenum cofactor synthesis domain-containing protein